MHFGVSSFLILIKSMIYNNYHYYVAQVTDGEFKKVTRYFTEYNDCRITYFQMLGENNPIMIMRKDMKTGKEVIKYSEPVVDHHITSKKEIKFIGRMISIGDMFTYDTYVPITRTSHTRSRGGIGSTKHTWKVNPNGDLPMYENRRDVVLWQELKGPKRLHNVFRLTNIYSDGITLEGRRIVGGETVSKILPPDKQNNYTRYGEDYENKTLTHFERIKFKIYKKDNELLFI